MARNIEGLLPGRAGRPHKLTRTVRETFEDVFKTLQSEDAHLISGADLETWAMTNPTEFYKLAAKMIPADLRVQGNMVLNVITGVPDRGPTNEELEEFC